MSGDWAQQLAEELHKPITRKFTKRRVFSKGVDEIWAADLVEMGKFSEWNKGFKYLLMVIDVFSKFGWIEPLKDKKGETVAAAFEKFFKLRQPRLLWTDKGREFYNKNVNQLLSKKNISSRGDGVTSAFSKLRPIWISHLYYFFPKMGKLK